MKPSISDFYLAPCLDRLESALDAASEAVGEAPGKSRGPSPEDLATPFFNALEAADPSCLDEALRRLDELLGRAGLKSTQPTWFGLLVGLRAGARAAIDRAVSMPAHEGGPFGLQTLVGPAASDAVDASLELWFQWLGFEVTPWPQEAASVRRTASTDERFLAERRRSPVPDRWLVQLDRGAPAEVAVGLQRAVELLREARGETWRGLLLVDGEAEAVDTRDVSEAPDVVVTPVDQVRRAVADFDTAAAHLRRLVEADPEESFVDVRIRPEGGERVESLWPWLEDWLAGDGHVLTLLGQLGGGKSTLCRRLARRLLQADDGPQPVLISLGEHSHESFQVEGMLARHFQAAGASVAHPEALVQSVLERRLLLILDGFGEWVARMPPQARRPALERLLALARGRAKIVVTSRPLDIQDPLSREPAVDEALGPAHLKGGSLLRRLDDGAAFRLVRLQEFDADDIETYVRRNAPGRLEDVRRLLARADDLRELAGRPFMLRMILDTLPDLAVDDSLDLMRLYESYCRPWLEPEEHGTGVVETFERRHLAECIAVRLWADGLESFDSGQADAWLGRTAVTGPSPRRARLVERALRRAPFLRRDGRGRYEPIHRSFLELFLSRAVLAGLDAGDDACLNVPPLSPRTGAFLVGAGADALLVDMASKILEQPYRRRISENALLLLLFVARGRHGLTSAGSGDPPNAWSADVAPGPLATFAELRPAGLHLRQAELSGLDLRAIDLVSADLRGARLDGADLRFSRLDAADLTGASLSRADLRQARLEGAQLEGTDLREADLRQADIRLARCARADFTAARVEAMVSSGAGFLATRGLPHELLSSAVGLRAVLQSGHSWRVSDVAWHPQLPLVASSAEDGLVLVWNVTDERLLRRFSGHGRAVHAVAWDPSGRRLATGSEDRTVRIWDAESGACLHVLRAHRAGIGSVAWSGDGRRLASASEDQTLRIWDTEEGTCLHSLTGHSDRVNTVAWEQGSERVASGSDDWTVRVWNAADGKEAAVLAGHSDGVHAVAWSPDGTRLASGSDDWTVRVWDPADGRCTRTLSGHSEGVHAVAWHPQGRTLASGAFDRAIRLWDTEVGRALDKLTGHSGWVRALDWDPSGRRLASGASSRAVRIWDVEERRTIRHLGGFAGWINAVAWSPDGCRLASGSSGHTVRVWDRRDGTSRALRGHEDRVHTVAWDPSGERLASGADDRTVRVWDVASQTESHLLEGHAGWIRAVTWSPDGSRLASGADDRTVRIWDAVSGAALRTLEGHNGWVRALAWDPLGRFLASGADDGTIKLWQPETGQLMQTLGGHGAWVLAIAWSPDGSRLASGTGDGKVFLWDTARGRRLGILTSHDAWVHTVAWSDDGSELLTASVDGSVRIFGVADQPQDVLEPVRIEAGFVWHAAWAKDMLALAAPEGRIGLWRLGYEADGARCVHKVADLWGTPKGGLVITDDDRVDGDPVALEAVRFVDNGWAVYEIDELPDRHHPETVRLKLGLPQPETASA